MPDPYMPDHLLESLKADNARLILENIRLLHENHDLTVKVGECNDSRDQFAKALTVASDQNKDLKRKLGES